MKKFLPVFFILFFNFLAAQNLVPNGSFESYYDCPSNTDQVFNCVGWESVMIDFAQGYPTTPDYFNTCATSDLVSIPNNGYGYQNSNTGNAYCGELTFVYSAQNLREIIQAKFIAPMEIGSEYQVSMFASLAFNVNCNIASNKLGIRFSTIPFSNTTPPSINNWAHLYFISVIYDTLNWVPLQGSFIADSEYKYILVGNFFKDQNTNLVQVGQNYTYAYYFIDDICVALYGDSCGGKLQGVTTPRNFEFNIFPNPVKYKVTITGNTANEKIIYIRNLMGKLIFPKTLVKGTTSLEIDLSKFPEGIYFLSVEEGEKIFSQSIIIQH